MFAAASACIYRCTRCIINVLGDFYSFSLDSLPNNTSFLGYVGTELVLKCNVIYDCRSYLEPVFILFMVVGLRTEPYLFYEITLSRQC